MKELTFKDLNIVSGSSELLREVLGFSFVTGSNGFLGQTTNEQSVKISSVEEENLIRVQFNTSSFLPNVRIAKRIIGNQDEFRNDEEWRKFFIGGVFSEANYSGIFNTNVYTTHNIVDLEIPYFENEVKNIPTTDSQIQVTTEYFSHYPSYQNYVSSIEEHTAIPSFYPLYHDREELGVFLQNSSDFADLQYTSTDTYYNIDYVQLDNDGDESLENIIIKNYTDKIKDYNEENKTAGEAEAVAVDSDLNRIYSLSPYGVKISISGDFLGLTSNLYRSNLISSSAEDLFLRLLKESYEGDSATSPSSLSFVQTLKRDISQSESLFTEGQVSTTTATYRVIDLPSLITDSLATPVASGEDISGFLNNPVCLDTEGFYKGQNTTDSLKVLNFLNKRANLKLDAVSSLESILDATNYCEQVAFRVQKIGGQPAGDNRNDTTIQNFWFMNRDDTLTFLDNQVKYNTDYTYSLYSYFLIEGLRYKTDTLRTTRLLASSGSGQNCLEFYDPYTGITEQQLFSGENLYSLFDANQALRADINTLNSTIITQRILVDSFETNIFTKLNLAIDFDVSALFPTSPSYEIKLIDLVQTIKCENASCTETRNTLEYQQYYENIRDVMMPYLEELESFDSFEVARGISTGTDSEAPDNDALLLAIGFEELINDISSIRNPAIRIVRVLRPIVAFLNDLLSYIFEQFTNISELEDSIAENERLIEQKTNEINQFENRLATNAQVFSNKRYMADFYIYAEPSFKIVEVPLGEKTINIVDHPPVGLLIEPTYYKNGSKKLLFNIKRDVFSYDYSPHPATLTELDLQNKANYMQGKNLISTDNMKERSVSPERFVEIYRVSEKPSSYQDFFGNLRQTIDLKDELSGDFYGNVLFEERVATNTKYYYTFRLINENGVSGPFTPIYESVLVDDGGYIYGDFVQLEESELIENRASKISIPIKKLLNIVPQQEHLEINFADFDYSDTSLNQIAGASLGQNVDDPLINSAGRKFKFRLTSKKTQKKVDINITFDYMTK